MSYASGFALKLAARGAASWSVSTIESNKGTSGVTDYTSLAYAGGYAAISYRSTKSGGLKYARQSATGWRTEFVAAGGARYNALAFDQNGNPVIAFSDDLAPVDNQLDTLRVARWNGSRWSIAGQRSASHCAAIVLTTTVMVAQAAENSGGETTFGPNEELIIGANSFGCTAWMVEHRLNETVCS